MTTEFDVFNLHPDLVQAVALIVAIQPQPQFNPP